MLRCGIKIRKKLLLLIIFFRITKPGGHLCFTHFVEPSGEFIGSILQPVEKSYWMKMAEKYSLVNLRMKQMIHQFDRYSVCFSKRK